MQMADQIKHYWDIWLNILLAIGGALIAVAMAYAIIDVPSTGNARLPQRRFLGISAASVDARVSRPR